MIDDIPEAVRVKEPLKTKASAGFPLPLFMGSVLVGAVAIGAAWFLSFTPSVSQQETLTTESEESTTQITPSVIATPEKTEPLEASSLTSKTTAEIDNLLGHLPYEQANQSDLVSITSDRRILLQPAAAEKFRQMEADARAQGINLVVISGFRSLDAQDALFFEVKEQRVQDAAQRAEVSAPPGYSEHHTGYVVDLGDANAPSSHLSPEFENTAAFQWLEQNAAKYSFELSFPRDNPQGISYEPWHWRFVGDRKSLETFYKARNLQ